jgi:ABC-type multidrug transport system permease subunit
VDVTVLSVTSWPNFKLAEAMFELPWIFGFASIALYACGIVTMLADVNKANYLSYL